MRILVLSVASLALATVTFAQDDQAEFAKWMKSMASTQGSMRKHFEAKEAPGVASDAEKISDIFKNVEAYYTKSSTEDAAKLAKKAQVAANQVAEFAKQDDLEKAGVAAKEIGTTCGPCHGAHREKQADGTYKMK